METRGSDVLEVISSLLSVGNVKNPRGQSVLCMNPTAGRDPPVWSTQKVKRLSQASVQGGQEGLSQQILVTLTCPTFE